MNRWREDTRYVFRPPKFSAFWAPLIYRLSDAFFLRARHKVASVRVVSGGEEVLRAYRNGDSLLITPNHSDHADPHILLHLSGRFRIPIHFMAAREIFERTGGLNGVVLQRAGVFSIDREGSDLRAIKTAISILYEGRFPLVMFPEGEIFHLNEKLTPLNEGAAALALRAAKRIGKEKPGKRALIVPTAIRYRYIDDVSATFSERLARLEKSISWKPQTQLGVLDRIYKFGEAALALKEREFLDRTLEGPLDVRLRAFRETVIAEEEETYGAKASEGNHPTRVRRLRGRIRSVLLADTKPEQKVIDQCYRSLDRLHMAIQLYSYPGQYLRDRPSAERIAETLIKFEEDAFGECRVRARRDAHVTFCKPVNLADHLASFAERPDETVTEVTSLLESAIREALERPRELDGV